MTTAKVIIPANSVSPKLTPAQNMPAQLLLNDQFKRLTFTLHDSVVA